MKFLNKYLKDSKILIFFDLEGTQLTQEIIAIGAIKVTLNNKNNIKKKFAPFKRYVKSKGKIGPVVENLTGISEDLLQKEGIDFKDALLQFQNYVGNDLNSKFLSYGAFDLRLLHQTANINDLVENAFINRINHNYIDFSTILSQFIRDDKNQLLSLTEALDVLNVTFQGNNHDPEADAVNLMLLYQAFLKERGILKEQYIKVLLNNPKLPRPIHRLMKDLLKGKTISKDDLSKYVEEEL